MVKVSTENSKPSTRSLTESGYTAWSIVKFSSVMYKCMVNSKVFFSNVQMLDWNSLV